MLQWCICFIVRQEKPALTKTSHYEEFGNNIALRYSSLNCLLLIYISGLPLSFSGTTLNPIHSETDTERDLISKVSFFFQIKTTKSGAVPCFSTHHGPVNNWVCTTGGGGAGTRWLVLLSETGTGNSSTEWAEILSFKSRHEFLFKYGLEIDWWVHRAVGEHTSAFPSSIWKE